MLVSMFLAFSAVSAFSAFRFGVEMMRSALHWVVPRPMAMLGIWRCAAS